MYFNAPKKLLISLTSISGVFIFHGKDGPCGLLPKRREESAWLLWAVPGLALRRFGYLWLAPRSVTETRWLGGAGKMTKNYTITNLCIGGCSHQRSGDYYVASIMYAKDANVFVGHECDDWEDYTSNKCINHKTLEMGENVELIP